MAIKYKNTRMTLETWENWRARKKEMEEALKEMGVGKVQIPLTNILLEASRKPIFDFEDLKKLNNRKWRR